MSNDLNTLLGITSILGIGGLCMFMYKQSDDNADDPLVYEDLDVDLDDVDLDDFEDEEEDDEEDEDEEEDEEEDDEEDEKPKPKKRGRPAKK